MPRRPRGGVDPQAHEPRPGRAHRSAGARRDRGHGARCEVSARTELGLGANEFRQLSSILRAFGIEATYNATITVRAVGGDGRVAAYASSIDNVTGDPTYIPAQ